MLSGSTWIPVLSVTVYQSAVIYTRMQGERDTLLVRELSIIILGGGG